MYVTFFYQAVLLTNETEQVRQNFILSKYDIVAAYYQAAIEFSSLPHAYLFHQACLYVGLINIFCHKKYSKAAKFFDSKIEEIAWDKANEELYNDSNNPYRIADEIFINQCSDAAEDHYEKMRIAALNDKKNEI